MRFYRTLTRSYARLLGLLSLGLLPIPQSSAAIQAAPNIVVIMADDLGYGDLGCYGSQAIPTPNIDRLAAQGLRFTQAYAPSSTCTPSRYAFFSGEYAWRQPAKKTSILDGDAPLALDRSRPTLASFLREQGYATALVGKWHLGLGDGQKAVDFNGVIAPGPLEVGFDTAFFIPATVDRVPCVFIQDHRVAGLDPQDPIAVSYQRRVGDEPVGHEHPEQLKYGADRQHADVIVNGISRIGSMSGGRAARWVDEEIADTLLARCARFISEKRDRPFFLFVGAHDPHVPRMPHPRFRGRSQTGIRGDAIVQFDWLVGAIMTALRDAGAEENTLVLLTSDNGPVLFDGYKDGAVEANGPHRPAGPLRGWKYLRYEGGTRVPLIAKWPAGIKPGGTTNAMFSLHDMFATTAGLLQQSLPPGAGQDGLDLSPILRGEQPRIPRDILVEHGIGNALALRSGRWKYVPKNPDAASGIGQGADPADQRFREAVSSESQLFDLCTDPGEKHNLASERPAQVAELAALLAALQKTPESTWRQAAESARASVPK